MVPMFELVLTYANFGFLQVSKSTKCIIWFSMDLKGEKNVNKLLYQGHGQYYQLCYGVYN